MHKMVVVTALPILLTSCSSGISEFDKQAVVATVSCRDIADDAARLTCLDNASNELAKTLIVRENADGTREPYTADGDISDNNVIADNESQNTNESSSPAPPVIAQTADDEFGKERIKAARKSREKRKSRSITAQITEIVVDPFEKITVTLENGQVWRQLDSDDRIVRFPGKHISYTAEIKRGVLGNYVLTITERNRTIRVRRIQ